MIGLWVDIAEGIRSYIGRYLLSLFAMAIGIMTLMFLIASVDGLNQRAREIVAGLGVDVALLFDSNTGTDESVTALDTDHLEALRALNETQVSGIRRYRAGTVGSANGLSVVATDEYLAQVRRWPLTEGRFLDRYDIAHREPVAVVTHTLSQAWGWRTGHSIRVGDEVFFVVGVVLGFIMFFNVFFVSE